MEETPGINTPVTTNSQRSRLDVHGDPPAPPSSSLRKRSGGIARAMERATTGAAPVFAFILCLPASPPILAQEGAASITPEPRQDVEEIIVTGERHKFELRLRLMEAERHAYEVFNAFNDEARFDIVCSVQQPTGSRIHSDSQHCRPNFEIEALRAHSRDYLENLRAEYDPHTDNKTTTVASQPFASVIAAQQDAYRKKMKQVAEEHPEFVEALIEYSELKAQYEAAE